MRMVGQPTRWLILSTLTVLGTLSAAGLSTSLQAADEPAATVRAVGPVREGEDWPLFLGPLGTGISGETGLLAKWPEEGPTKLWARQLGEGYAPPAVMGSRVVVMHRLRDQEIVECVHAETGETLWKYEYETDFRDPYGYNGGSRCAAVLTKDRCYTFGPQGKLLCLNLADGKKVWENDTTQNWKIPEHFFGAGCTPILEGNLLIVLVGGQPNSGVVAFNAATGDVVWESTGQKTWEGCPTDDPGQRPYQWTGKEMVVSYSSPICATIHGQRHLLCLMRQGLVSLDPANGQLRFRYWFRSRTHESVNAARPVVIDDRIFLSAAYETGAAMLKVQPDSQSYEVLWRNKRGMSTHWSTPIYVDGHLYGFSGRHEPEARLQCVDAETGELKWSTNGYEGDLANLEQDPRTGRVRDKETLKPLPFPFYGRGSMLLADGKFVALAERGTLALLEPNSKEWKEISRVQFPEMGYPSWAAPILSRGRLFLRSESHLVCLDLKAAK